MGTEAPPGSACSRRNSSKPLQSGRPTSRIASAGGAAAKTASAEAASAQSTGSNPSCASTYRMVSAMPGSSSTTRMRGLGSMAAMVAIGRTSNPARGRKG
jgi:hypothetical protein